MEATSPQSASRPRDHVGALAKGLRVLEALAAHPAGMTLSDVAAATGSDRAAARRFLITLEAQGYVLRDGRRFTLSPRLIVLARQWIGGTPLWTYAEPSMRTVSEALGESCSAAVLAGPDIVYVARVAGRAIMAVSLDVGARLPAWLTSMGRVLLADLAPGALERALEATEFVPRTAKSLSSRTALEAELKRVRADGYALVDEELEIGLRSIAVLVRDGSGTAVAALNVSCPSARFTPDEMRTTILPLLRDAATGIEGHFLGR